MMMNEMNKEVALNLSRAIMTGQWDQVDALLPDDFRYTGDDKPAINKAQYIGFMKNMFCSAMTQMDMKFLRVIAEVNLVAVDYCNDMTHSGSFFGIPATGKRIHATGQFIREVNNGKVRAEWQTTNAMGLMQQLGAAPVQG
jgi:predicted ester cyclase